MTFDTDSIPSDATILDIIFNGYLYENNYPYWSITPMGSVNPITDGASAIYNQVSNNYEQGTAYSFNQESGTLTNGWISRTLSDNNAASDLQNALAQGWFAIGIVDWDFSTSYYVKFHGWDEQNIPYLEIIYEYVTPVELASFTAYAINDGVMINWTTATETNNQGFEIERLNPKSLIHNPQFEKAGYVAGFGTTTEPKVYTFTDKEVSSGTYTYRLKQIDFDGSYSYSNEVIVDVISPIEYALEQNYPNPFNPSTTIKYSIPEDGLVKLSVYNILGEEVAKLVNTVQKAGKYEVVYDASKFASGVYYYRMEAKNYTSIKKMILIK